MIEIPIMEDDTVYDLIHAFLQELHDKDFIYISNGSTGFHITNEIHKILYDNGIVKEEIKVPLPKDIMYKLIDNFIK
jgi:hypothetical protein